jgi:cysteine-rich repeat protein
MCVAPTEAECGNGVVEPGEECENSTDCGENGICFGCTCYDLFCGDGILSNGEECDDGNQMDGDGCSGGCEWEGDANNDGSLDVADVVVVIDQILDWSEYDSNADVNNDGEVNIHDIVQIITWILEGEGGLVRGLPLADVNISTSDGHLIISPDGDLAGLQLNVKPGFNLERGQLPAGWEMAVSPTRILIFSMDGASLMDDLQIRYSGELQIQSALAADWYGNQIVIDSPQIPQTFELYEPHPNPFNPVTYIRYSMMTSGEVSIVIYNTLGNKITVLENRWKNSGDYRVSWNASDYPSGIYFVSMEVNGAVQQRKVMLIK